MVRRILRRTLILVMIMLMVLVTLPVQEAGVYAAGTVNTGVDGLTASYDNGTWNKSGTSIIGSVKTSSSTSCGQTSYSPQTGTLTLTSTKSESMMLSFSYTSSLNGGSLKIDGVTVADSGSFSKLLNGNDTVAITIASPDSLANETKVTITGLSLEKKTVTTTFTTSMGGSYTVDGAPVTEDITRTQDSTVPYAVVATASSGYKFYGWYDVNTDTYLSTTASTNLYVTSNTTIKPVFITSDTAVWEVGSKSFFDLNEAISYSSSSGNSKITLIGDGTLPAGTYTIPSGKTVLIPFDVAKTVYTNEPAVVYNSHTTPTPFRMLTMASGAQITVQNGGALCVSSQLCSSGQMGGWNGCPTGPGGRINMNSGSSITLNSGANLYCWGYIYGDGMVTAQSGSTVYEAFQIKDWRGGTATSNIYSYAFIFNQYYIQNIEVPLRVYAGATEKLYSSVNASSSAYPIAATLIGSGGMFNISSGYLEKDYIEATDRLNVDIYGNASITPMTITNLPMIGSISTDEYVLPITSNLGIDIHSGTTTVTQDIELLPGVEIKTQKNATFTINSGKKVYMYDNDDWGNFSGATRMYPIGYSVANGTATMRSAASLKDAVLDVNGNVSVSGSLYTSAGGADITSSEKSGTVTFVTASPTQNSTIYEMANNSTKTAVSFDPARLHNGDNSYVETKGQKTEFFYCSTHDKWETGNHYVVTLNPNGGEGSAITLNFCSEGGNLPANTFTREDYEFAGWNTKADGTGTAYEDEATINPTANITLYAQWTEKACEHNLVATGATAATCTEAGNSAYWTCSICGRYYSDEEGTTEIEENSWVIEPLGHDLVHHDAKAATCTEPGWAAYDTCSRCDYTTYVEIPAPGHDLIHHDAQAATCTESGWNAYDTCSRCDYTTYVEISATGHTEVIDQAIAPTCTETGLTEGKHCSVCGAVLVAQETVPAKGHTWNDGEITTEPTCNETGTKTFTCTVCGETRTETVAALGHDLVKTAAQAATCTSAGNSEYWTCTRCGNHFNDALATTVIIANSWVIPATGHTPSETVQENVVGATCTAAGSYDEVVYCSVCGVELSRDHKTTEALGHSWGEGVITTEATCTEAGVKTFTCERCGETRTESIDALGHDYVHHEAQAATCTEKGWNAYDTCSRCDYTTYVEIPAKGHTPGEAVIENAVAATCTEAGSYDEVVYCTVCGAELEREHKTTEALGHTLTATPAVAPTCTEAGNSAYWTCSVCGKYFSDAQGTTEIEENSWVIPANGHTWNEGEITTEPTCIETGVKTFTCTVCGEARTESVAALGHDLTHTAAVEATCTEAGNIEYWTCDRCGNHFSDAQATTVILATSLVIPATGHSPGETVIENAVGATCTEACTYDEVVYCTVCGAELEREHKTTEALGHAWDEGVVTTEPTCTVEGVKTFTCTRCGETKTEAVEALGHDLVHHDAQAATCTEIGWDAYDMCSRCDYTTYVETAALGHAWDEGVVTTEPTCTEAGVKTFTCERCDATRTEDVAALGHDLKATAAKDPTCTEAGNIAYWTCDRCHEIFSDEAATTVITLADTVVAALGHAWDDGVITTQPTCTEAGVKTFTCQRCDATRTEEVAALGHDLVHHGAQSATCTEHGWDAYDTCSRCDYTTYVEIPALGHDLKATAAKDPTCTEDGNIAYWTCDRCHEIFSDEAATTVITLADTVTTALGHAWDEGVITTQPTCTEAGVKTFTCERCGETKTESVDALGHDLKATAAKDPTCTEDGNIAYWTCDRCHEIFSDEAATTVITLADTVIAALGHDWDEGVVTTEPTCTEAGVKTFTCERCDATRTEEVAALGHDLIHHGAQSATCTEHGWDAYDTCSRCDYTTYVEIPALGHDLKSTAAKAATCTEDGNIAYWTCDRCHEIFSDEAATTVITLADTVTTALGHAWDDGVVTTEPTCTEAGVKTFTCERCGETKTEYVDALGHDLKATAAKDPTCTEDGNIAYWTCDRCHEIFSDEAGTTVITLADTVIAALGHAWDEGVVTTEPTCTEAGVKTFTCQRCDATRTEEVAALGHDLKATAAKDPTCTEDGNIAYWTCDRCHEIFSDEAATTVITLADTVTTALGHAWDEGVITTQPTCTETGVKTFTCQRCDATRTEEVAALGHDLIHHEAQAATCTEHGWNAYDTCSRCDYTTYVEIAALGHDYVHHEAQAATCTEIGWNAYDTCTRCDYTTYEEMAALGHDYVHHEAQAATCTEHGWDAYDTCSRCDYTTYVEIPALGHDLKSTAAKAATCTEDGNIAYWTCDRCHQIFSDEAATTVITLADTVISATGHAYGTPTYAWADDNSTVTAVVICANNPAHIETETVNTTFEEILAPTCEVAGSRTYTAEFTNDLFTTQTKAVETSATGHDYGEPTYEWSADKSTCTARAICKNDPAHVKEEAVISTSVTTDATCTDEGQTVYTATFTDSLFNQQTETVVIPATGHSYGEPTYEWAADNSTVTAKAVCAHDNAHVLSETVDTTKAVTPATCEVGGKTVYTAVFENSKFETQTKTIETPALGHTWGTPTYEWAEDNSTCTATAVCGNDPTHILTEEATITSEVTTEPTCETTGIRTHTATFENDKFETQTATETIPASGHDLEATAATDATCTETGNTAYWTCKTCGKYFSDAEGTNEIAANSWITPALGHKLIHTEAHPATCTEPGNKEYWTCERCGLHFGDAEAATAIAVDSWIIPANGHVWNSGEVTIAATCTHEGEMLYTCTVCNATRTEVIAQLAHNLIEMAAHDPTCTQEGNTAYYVCDSCGQYFSDAAGTTAIEEGSWIIPANGHTFGDWVVVESPTCVDEGSEQRTCTVCGYTETQNIDPNGHTWEEEFTIDQEPDCTTDGSKSRHCHYCNQKTDVTVIPALGHDWDTENVVFNWSDDLSEAEAVFTCKRDPSHVETLKAAVTSETAAGLITYTATVVFENATYTDQQVANAHEVLRIKGKNRYETCIKIADYYIERNNIDKLPAVVIATGGDFPDALTGAYLANLKHAPIMLIDASKASRIAEYLNNHLAPDATIYVLGGQKAVDESWLADLSSYTIKRLEGKNRFITNMSILKESGVTGGDIFVCTGANYADSLSASAIDMPILIVGTTLRDDQKEYLAGGNWTFHLVGGTAVVSDDIASELAAYGTVAERTSGKNRYLTSKAMAERFIGDTHEAVLAYGANFPDGLCGGPLAYTMGAPIILSGSSEATSAPGIEYTTQKNITSGLVLGGASLIDDATVRATFAMSENDEIVLYEE